MRSSHQWTAGIGLALLGGLLWGPPVGAGPEGQWGGSEITKVEPWWEPTEAQQAYAADGDLPPAFENGQGQKLVLIPPGRFMMGSPASESGRYDEEGPRHEVEIGHGFYVGATEVTNGQYQAFVRASAYDGRQDANGRYLKHLHGEERTARAGAEYPVVNVSWKNAQAYVRWLTEQERSAGRLPRGWTYRLPTEAEWEYACRAGTTGAYSFGNSAGALGEYGWYDGNSGRKTHPVGRKRANPWGLFDMHGNVWEWCQSVLAGYPYRAGDGPEPSSDSGMRVLRGGSWLNPPRNSRSADRGARTTVDAYDIFGFRVVCAPTPGSRANP